MAQFIGGEGPDTLIGGAEDDFFEGGLGADVIYGLGGHDSIDSLALGGAGDTVYGGSGNDSMHSAVEGASVFFGEGGNDTFMGGAAAVYGGPGNDYIVVTQISGAGLIDGGGGYDTFLDAGSAKDHLRNFEEYWLHWAFEFNELSPESPLSDAVVAAGATLRVVGSPVPDSENFGRRGMYYFDGSEETDGHYIIVGWDESDTLIGGAQSDTISGGLANDLLMGGGGNDSIDGGAGFDTAVYTGNRADYAIDTVAGGVRVSGPDGVDYLRNVNYLQFDDQTIPIEDPGRLIIGTEGSDSLVGGIGVDTMRGLEGNDTLNGSLAEDVMQGDSGNDVYFVDHVLDQVIETSNAGALILMPGEEVAAPAAGITDSVIASVNYSLANVQYVENLKLAGSASRATGNSLHNKVIGNEGADILAGGAGNDTLNGGAGADRIKGGSGKDVIFWGSGDVVNGGSGFDRLKTGSLDLTQVRDGAIRNVEAIDLTGSGRNRLTLNKADVLALSDSTNEIRILGDTADSINIVGAFGAGSISGNYRTYTVGTGTLLIDTDITAVS